MVTPDTINALATLAVFIAGGVAAVATAVSHRALRDQSTKPIDGTAGTLDQSDAGAELVRTPTLELRVRQVCRCHEDVEWIATVTADPYSGD